MLRVSPEGWDNREKSLVAENQLGNKNHSDNKSQRMYNVAMKRINVYLPEPMLRELQRIAKEKGVPVAELIRRALENEYASKMARRI